MEEKGERRTEEKREMEGEVEDGLKVYGCWKRLGKKGEREKHERGDR